MEKTKLKILVVDRALEQGEHPVSDIFSVYKQRGFDMVVFPYKEDKQMTEIIILNTNLWGLYNWERLLSTKVNYDGPGFYDCDLEGVETDVFYEILEGEFEIDVEDLTSVEKKSV